MLKVVVIMAKGTYKLTGRSSVIGQPQKAYPCYTLMSNNKDNAGQLLETEGKYGKAAALATMAIWLLR